MESSPFSLSGLPASFKLLITGIVLSLSVGYAVSLLQVRNRGSFNLQETARHFRGSVSEGEGMYLPQSDATMISVAHVHTFSQPVVLGVIGLLFALTSASEAAKIFWILASFAGSLGMNAGPWLVRDVSEKFVYGLYFSGGLMEIAFVVMAIRVLHEVWKKKILIETKR